MEQRHQPAPAGHLQSAIKGFEASHPNVKITNVPIQNEPLQDTKIPLALEGNNPPNIYQQWGGGVLGQQVTSGKVDNITSDVSSWIGSISGASGWQANGQQYGVPVDLHVVGFWYRKDIFKKVGITVPTTLAQLESDDTKLRAEGYAPIAVGSKDRWPDAFWWEYFALRDCPQATVTSAIKSESFSASCFGQASTNLAAFLKTNPFQTGFLGTSSQQGAGSSAGLVASGKAAMELQGDWDPSVMEGVSTNKNLSSELGWFPFPQTPGSAGSQTAVLGGGDGYSCTGTPQQAQACAEFLQYLDSPADQAQIVGPGARPASRCSRPSAQRHHAAGDPDRGGLLQDRLVRGALLRHGAADQAGPEPRHRDRELLLSPEREHRGRHRQLARNPLIRHPDL